MFSSWLTEPELPKLLHSELPTAHDGEGDKEAGRRRRRRREMEGWKRNVEKERKYKRRMTGKRTAAERSINGKESEQDSREA